MEEESAALLQGTGATVGVAVDGTATESLARLQRHLQLVQEPAPIEAALAGHISALVPPSALLLYILDPGRNLFVARYAAGPGADPGARPRRPGLRRRGRLAAWLREHQRPLLLDPAAADVPLDPAERELVETLGIRLAVPLLSTNRLIGVVLLAPAGGEMPDAETLRLLALLANQAALALDNAALRRRAAVRRDRLRRSEHLASVGRVAASAAHDIRNPLTAIRSTLQHVAAHLDPDDESTALVNDLVDEVDRIDAALESLLGLSRHTPYEPCPVDLAELADEALGLLRTEARGRGVELASDVEDRPLRIEGDADQLRRLLVNLLLNGLQAMPGGGELSLSLGRWSPEYGAETGPWVQLEIADSGEGIPEERMERIFDPLFTTRPDGTGLGLSIAHEVVARHEGEMDVDSEVGEGTTFIVRFPGA